MLRPVHACALAALLSGCAGPSAQLRSDEQRLETEVAELRAENRVQRRTIRDLENRIALLRDRDREARSVDEVPELPIEVKRPGQRRPGGGPQEFAASGGAASAAPPAGARPRSGDEGGDEEVLVLTNIGKRDGSRGRRRERRADPPRRQAPRADAPVPAATERLPAMDGEVPTVSSRLGGGEPDRRDPKADYRRYLEALRAGNHGFAITGFRNFTAEYPKHALADNAQYWLAEAHYDQDEFEAALAAFRDVVSDYPGGNKIPDAMLKIGYCHIELGDGDAARRVLQRVAERYADTSPARLAADALDSLGD